MTQGVSSPGAVSLLLGTGPLSRIQGLHARAQLSPCRAQDTPSGVQSPLCWAKVPSRGTGSPPRSTGPLRQAHGSLPRRNLHSDGHRYPPWSRGSPLRAQPPVRGAHSRLTAAQRIPRGRGASRSGQAVLGAASSRSAAQRIREDAARPPRAARGCASHPAARRGPGAGLYRVWGRWSGPQPPALRGLSHLPRAYINAAVRVPVALPRVTLRPRDAGVWLWALRRARLAPRPRPGAPRRRLSLSHLSLSRCLSLCLNLSAGGSAPSTRPAPAAAAARARSCRGGASARRRRARARASGPRTGVPARLRRESRGLAVRTKIHLVPPGRLEREGSLVRSHTEKIDGAGILELALRRPERAGASDGRELRGQVGP